VAVTNLNGHSYNLTVTGATIYLKSTSASQSLTDALEIATGGNTAGAPQLGNMTAAEGVSTGVNSYSTGDAANFVALTGTAQTIGSDLTSSTPIYLVVFQPIEAGESHTVAADYDDTLTYTASPNF
jgi:hypothetical protein